MEELVLLVTRWNWRNQKDRKRRRGEMVRKGGSMETNLCLMGKPVYRSSNTKLSWNFQLRWSRICFQGYTIVCSIVCMYDAELQWRTFLFVYSLAVSKKYFEQRNQSAPIRWVYVTAIFIHMVLLNSPLCTEAPKVQICFLRRLYRFIQPLF